MRQVIATKVILDLHPLGLGGPGILRVRLQFHTVPRHPGQIDLRRWSSLNQAERLRPKLLMRLGSCTAQVLVSCRQYCCQATGRRLTLVDNRGISAQPMTRDGRSWTTCPLLPSRWSTIPRHGCEIELRDPDGNRLQMSTARGGRAGLAIACEAAIRTATPLHGRSCLPPGRARGRPRPVRRPGPR
jgi:hypothetical protein